MYVFMVKHDKIFNLVTLLILSDSFVTINLSYIAEKTKKTNNGCIPAFFQK